MQTQSQPPSCGTMVIGPECCRRPVGSIVPVVRSATTAAGPPTTRSFEGVGGVPGMKTFGSGEPIGTEAGRDGADVAPAEAGDVPVGTGGGTLPTFGVRAVSHTATKATTTVAAIA